MTQENISAAERLIRTGRSGSSRKLLRRKAVEKAAMAPAADTVEDSFPPAALVAAEAPQSSSSSPSAAPPPQAPPLPPLWSSEDEAALQGLLARRKAAGYHRRGKDVAGQRLRPRSIKPNDGTVAAVIVGIVAERGEIDRAGLIAAMASATFPHPKARPADKSWCQGYVAGVIRSGFLALAEPSASPAGEGSANPGEGSASPEER